MAILSAGVFFIHVFACPQRGHSNEYPRLVVKVFGHVQHLEGVGTHRIGYVEKCHNVSVKSRRRTKVRIRLRSSPMQGCKRDRHKHERNSTHLTTQCSAMI